MKIVRITLLGCLAAVWIVACGQDTVEPPSPDPVDSLHNEGDIVEQGAVERTLWKVLNKAPYSKFTDQELATVTHLPKIRGFPNDLWPGELDLLIACVNLVELDIEIMHLSNEHLAALGGLTKLESLKLFGNRITDLSPIARLTNLRTLDISRNPIADLRLRPVVELPNLTALSASGIGLTDLRPLAGLVNLQHLELWDNDIDDLTPLAGLVNLQYLVLWGNKIDDLTPLVGLVQLERLNLNDNEIVDIQPLLDNVGIGAGDKIELQGNKLSEISRQQLIPKLEARGARVRLVSHLFLSDTQLSGYVCRENFTTVNKVVALWYRLC